MKILFLDIDGVLNTISFMMNNPKCDVLELDKIINLNKIINSTDCKIVVSSNWRVAGIDHDSLYYNALLNTNKNIGQNIIDATIDTTPVVDYVTPRWQEINLWLNCNSYDKFVILEDQWDMDVLSPYTVMCDCMTGLTNDLTNKAIDLLL
jgi:hypothetical protein